MPKKKLSPRKKPTRKTSSHRELPRVPALEPWTRKPSGGMFSKRNSQTLVVSEQEKIL